jgi:hypothetical protein
LGSPCSCRAPSIGERQLPESKPRSKKLDEAVADLARLYPAEVVELWTQDEARLGLKPILRRQWAPRGQRPLATARPAYEWLWLYAAVHPESGRVFWLVLPYLYRVAYQSEIRFQTYRRAFSNLQLRLISLFNATRYKIVHFDFAIVRRGGALTLFGDTLYDFEKEGGDSPVHQPGHFRRAAGRIERQMAQQTGGIYALNFGTPIATV